MITLRDRAMEEVWVGPSNCQKIAFLSYAPDLKYIDFQQKILMDISCEIAQTLGNR